jgi:rhodanese-related sulfurtransferase
MNMTPSELLPHEVETTDMTVIDIREPGEFAGGHLPDSVNLPLAEIRHAIPVLHEHARSGGLLVVCSSGNRSLIACTALAEAGVTASSLAGGTEAWEADGRSLSRFKGSRKVWSMERQVRFTAGSLVLLGVTLGLTLPSARWVAAAVGVGMVYSAVSNTCAMTAVLSRLPFNRSRSTRCDWRTALRPGGGC